MSKEILRKGDWRYPSTIFDLLKYEWSSRKKMLLSIKTTNEFTEAGNDNHYFEYKLKVK